MRIIGGQFGGRRFTPPAKNWKTRPTTDFAKEGLYNVLTNMIDFEGTKMLDLFGGTGNHSYEFISRGCTDVTLVEKYHGCISFVKKISEELKIEDHISIVKTDVFKFLERNEEEYDFIFADPPYDHRKLKDLPTLILSKDILATNGIFILEHDNRHLFEGNNGFIQSRNYGNVHFSFFRKTT